VRVNRAEAWRWLAAVVLFSRENAMRTVLTALIFSAGLGTQTLAAEAPAGGAWTDCSVVSVAAFRDYVLVTCAEAPGAGLKGAGVATGTPREFGIEAMSPLTDPTLRLSMAAKAGGRPLGILYVKDSAANPPGCLLERCRRIAGVELK